MRQIYPADADLPDPSLAGRYAYPDLTAAAEGPGRWLRANMIASLDGASTVSGRSGGLSGEADRQVFAMLRALADVILVGAGTARVERYEPVKPGSEGRRWAWLRDGRPPSPPIAVVTRRLDLDLEGPLLTAPPGQARTIVITTRAAPAGRRTAAALSAEVVVAGETAVDMHAAAGALAGLGHRRILCEGGPHLLSQIIGAGLLDDLCLTVSPLLVGPGSGRIVHPAGERGATPGSARPIPPTAQPPLAAPLPCTLAHVIADEGYLLCRYVRPGVSQGRRQGHS